MKTYNITQGTQEWFDARKGKMTASHAQEIATAGKGLDTYCIEIISEKYSTNTERYSNEHTIRGHELEEQARDIYSLVTGKEVEQVGFIELDEYTGCSPDGMTKTGLVEIKCHSDAVYAKLLITGSIETKYIWQMQMQMYITGKDYCDYVAYNPNFKRSLFIQKITREEEKIQKIIEGLATGRKILSEYDLLFSQKNHEDLYYS